MIQEGIQIVEPLINLVFKTQAEKERRRDEDRLQVNKTSQINHREPEPEPETNDYSENWILLELETQNKNPVSN